MIAVANRKTGTGEIKKHPADHVDRPGLLPPTLQKNLKRKLNLRSSYRESRRCFNSIAAPYVIRRHLSMSAVRRWAFLRVARAGDHPAEALACVARGRLIRKSRSCFVSTGFTNTPSYRIPWAALCTTSRLMPVTNTMEIPGTAR